MASSKERVPVVIVEYDEIARTIAKRIAEIIKERRQAGGHAVLGLATGSTPIGIYRELIKMHREGVHSIRFNQIEIFMQPPSITMLEMSSPRPTRKALARVLITILRIVLL